MKIARTVSPQQLADEILWAGSSPHLLVHPDYPPRHSESLMLACAPALASGAPQLHRQIREYAEAMVLKSHFLGARFERAYQAAWQLFGTHAVREANLQVTHEGQTLGEFDLLLDGPGGFVHQELAVKFYLGVSAGSRGHVWFGPGQRDRLDLKLEALLQRQLRLSEDSVAVDLLSRLDISVAQVELVLKGFLFYPLTDRTALSAIQVEQMTPAMSIVDKLLTEAHLRGYWVSKSDLFQLQPYGQYWSILPKPLWLQPVKRNPFEGMTFSQLQSAIHNYFAAEEATQLRELPPERPAAARPLMVVSLDETEGVLVEGTRFFITPEDWASRALQHLGPKLR